MAVELDEFTVSCMIKENDESISLFETLINVEYCKETKQKMLDHIKSIRSSNKILQEALANPMHDYYY